MSLSGVFYSFVLACLIDFCLFFIYLFIYLFSGTGTGDQIPGLTHAVQALTT
jgi:hypothetical protein